MAHLTFVEHGNPGKKTKRWLIVPARGGDAIGYIEFYAPWRKYIWSMLNGAIFDVGCTQEVVDFLRVHAGDRQQ